MQTQSQAPDSLKKPFELEPTEKAGLPSGEVITELCSLRTQAKEAASNYGDAIKAQAEKYHLRAAALKSYIAALQDLDKLINEL